MTPQQRREIQRHLDAFDFSGLFTDAAVGWNWPDVGDSITVPFNDDFIKLDAVAEKEGVKILLCPPLESGQIPNSKQRRAIEKAVRPLAAEHLLIFTNTEKTQQIWQWAQHRTGKPIAFREVTWEQGKSNEALIQKICSIAFTLDEEEGLDITGVVKKLTDQLDRDRVTKKFYEQFKKQKDAFAKFIEGLSDEGLTAWYTSLMLNRIMFCYFLQRKGFLDGDQNYLSNRLSTIQETIGEDSFHSFYRTFLRRLFHEGLGEHPDKREKDLQQLIGTIPYLNGGLFDEHPIERGNPDLHVPDEAFEKVFAFLDEFEWHLDDRPLSDGNEINPEILGYVFEKYTNQKEMGAYYTKEDITEYISKNCIIPFLFQKISKKLPAEAWDRLKDDPDRYLYDAVKQGAGESREDWIDSLPENIRLGLVPESLQEVVQQDKAVKTLELRKDWNTTTPASHSLPTEIWRETISRHQRCHDLRDKLVTGEVASIDDFITLNLNIRQFAQDTVDDADAGLLLAFFDALKGVSVLDPTCGSGAFLFAALEILQPLYLACIERMRVLMTDWENSGEKHPVWQKKFQHILDHADDHPNEAYYIHKTIIVHNLYGVDIMEEAVEICKLRLFLKLAAQLEQGQEVEPLPDIDFNIRAGNTLVGYASKNEIQRAFTEHQGGGAASQMLLGGIEHSLDDYRRILEQAEDADRAFQRFHQLQEDTKTKPEDFRSAKQELNNVLQALRDQLDRFLAADYDARNLHSDKAFEKWRKSHEPFHWFIEFYGIMDEGGFDIVIGNPPYVEYRDVKKYSVRGYATIDTGDLYAFTTERSFSISKKGSHIGLIVPISVSSTSGFKPLQEMLIETFSKLYLSFYSNRPAQIFSGAQKRLTILIGKTKGLKDTSIAAYTSGYLRWLADERDALCQNLDYHKNDQLVFEIDDSFTKIGLPLEAAAMTKVFTRKATITTDISRGDNLVYYTRKFGYFLDFLCRPPRMTSIASGEAGSPSELKTINCASISTRDSAIAALSSSLFFWFWNIFSDCRNLNKRDLLAFPAIYDLNIEKLPDFGKKYSDSLSNDTGVMTKSGWQIETFNFKTAKPIIDEIDTLLAAHYGFTEEELDFIINYDIKYRMGLG